MAIHIKDERVMVQSCSLTAVCITVHDDFVNFNVKATVRFIPPR